MLPGYKFANWEQGYGDVALQPDLTTLRRIPWLEATALVMCDVVDEHDAANRSRSRRGASCNGRSSARPRPATR